MQPGVHNLVIYRGDEFTLSFLLRETSPDGSPGAPIDLTGRKARAQIRTTEDNEVPQAEFFCIVADQEVAKGLVTLRLTSEQTSTLVNGVWDVQLDNPVKTYLRGKVTVKKQVTR